MHNATFRPGLYRHYKGGLYTAVALITHHETGKPMVLYVSHTYGGLRARPLEGYPGDPDGWNVPVEVDGAEVPRFEFIGEVPTATPITQR